MTWYDENEHLFFKKYDYEVLIKEITNYKGGKTTQLKKTFAHFFDYDMYSCRGARGSNTPLEIIKDDEQIKEILDFTKTKPNFYPPSSTESRLIKTYFRNAGRKAQKVSNFPVLQATTIYKKYTSEGDTIYDPSCGFGSRMSASIINNRNYVGSDPNLSLVKSLNKCSQFYKDNFENIGSCKIMPNGSEIYHEELKNNVDFIFTSPPYFDLELYGNDSGQSVIKFPKYEDWLKYYVEPTIRNCVEYLKKGKFMIINIKSNKKHDLFNDWKGIMSKYLTFVQIVDIMTTNSGKAERDYKGKHFTGAKTDFGLKEKAMVFMKEESKEKEMSEVENNFSQNPERQTGVKVKKEVIPEKGKLEATFGVPPFSILDSRQKYWLDRKKEWLSIGIESEIGRDAEAFNAQSWVKDKKILGMAGNLSGVSIFDPVLTELMYKWFCPPNGTILDPFAGGSVRGIVSSALGYEYTGVDLRQEQVDANYENIDKLSIKLPIDPVWLQGDSTDIQNVGGEYDMIFSCPPYFDLEEYSKDPKDLSNMTYENFVKQYSLIIKNAVSMLKDNSFAVFVVGEIRDEDGFNRNFVGDTINAFMETGMKFYNEVIKIDSIGSLPMRVAKQFEPYRKLGKVHQNVLVFYKAHSRKGTQRIFKLPECKFTPIKEMNIEPRERLKIITTRSLDNIETKMRTKDIECEDCHAVSATREAFEKHLTGTFHKRMVGEE